MRSVRRKFFRTMFELTFAKTASTNDRSNIPAGLSCSVSLLLRFLYENRNMYISIESMRSECAFGPSPFLHQSARRGAARRPTSQAASQPSNKRLRGTQSYSLLLAATETIDSVIFLVREKILSSLLYTVGRSCFPSIRLLLA